MKNVFIVGGSSGIGAAAAREAAKKGWGVFVGFKSGKNRAEELVSQIKKGGGAAWAVQIDLGNSDSILAAFTQIAASTPSLDAVVLSASPAPVLNSFTKTTPQEILAQFNVNVIGHHQVIVQAWKTFFIRQKGGHVIGLLSAAAGNPPWPHMSSYVMAKRAFQAMLESALVELGKSGLRCSVFSPDYTRTPMLEACNPHVIEMARAKSPAGRFLEPDEVAAEIAVALENPPTQPMLSAKDVFVILPAL